MVQSPPKEETNPQFEAFMDQVGSSQNASPRPPNLITSEQQRFSQVLHPRKKGFFFSRLSRIATSGLIPFIQPDPLRQAKKGISSAKKQALEQYREQQAQELNLILQRKQEILQSTPNISPEQITNILRQEESGRIKLNKEKELRFRTEGLSTVAYNMYEDSLRKKIAENPTRANEEQLLRFYDLRTGNTKQAISFQEWEHREYESNLQEINDTIILDKTIQEINPYIVQEVNANAQKTFITHHTAAAQRAGLPVTQQQLQDFNARIQERVQNLRGNPLRQLTNYFKKNKKENIEAQRTIGKAIVQRITPSPLRGIQQTYKESLAERRKIEADLKQTYLPSYLQGRPVTRIVDALNNVRSQNILYKKKFFSDTRNYIGNRLPPSLSNRLRNLSQFNLRRNRAIHRAGRRALKKAAEKLAKDFFIRILKNQALRLALIETGAVIAALIGTFFAALSQAPQQ